MKHLRRDLENLKREILAMGRYAEEATGRALDAMLSGDVGLAEAVIEGDERLDRKEMEVEEECLKILALHQPVAADLRFIVAVLKVNNDLERIGDLAANIAKRSITLSRSRKVEPPPEMRTMMERVQEMVVGSLDALVKMDAGLARDILTADEVVDSIHKRMYRFLQERMQADPDHIPEYIQVLSISRNLERIADQSTNVAEDVIFTVEGELVRHGGWEEKVEDDDASPAGGHLRIVKGGEEGS